MSQLNDRNAGSLFGSAQRSMSPLGALWHASDGSCEFTVWAPHAARVEVVILGEDQSVDLAPEKDGYYQTLVPDIQPGMHYFYRLNGDKQRADPASRYQPEGVFGPSEIVNLENFIWHDRAWDGLELKDYIFYELHVGTYTPAGTLHALIDYIAELKSLGVTALELMPLAQFPGSRNWGYDGAYPYAVQNSYGGPRGLQHLVDACHREGLAVVLDVVYNHLGPEGNFLAEFGPYFTERYRTPWGPAINFDGAHSDEVVRFFVDNALYWLENFHIDALRLDAIHGIVDRSAQPFLALLSAAVEDLAHRTNRRIYLIAESDHNDSRLVRSLDTGGYGLHAQWNDDFHHALHSLQTGEGAGYYRDFGSLRHLQKALRHGYVYRGEYSEFRQRRHGNSSCCIRPSQFVVFSQNHDQVGNRMLGERSSTLLGFEAQKLSAGVVTFSANLPLFFMGEEYGETAPFLYFTNHSDPRLGEAVQEGRRAEFAEFNPAGNPPNPQAESTFLQSKLDHRLREKGRHLTLWNFYRELIRLRNNLPALRELDMAILEVSTCSQGTNCMRVLRKYEQNEVVTIFNFGDIQAECGADIPAGNWQKCLNSADVEWMGPGGDVASDFSTQGSFRLLIAPKSLCVLQRAPST